MSDPVPLTPAHAEAAALDDAVGGVRPLADAERPPSTDRWGYSPDLADRLAPINDFLYDHWFRTEPEGLEHIPAGGALLVANHAGAVPPDAQQIQWAIRRRLGRDVAMMGENLFARTPVAGWLFRRIGGVEAAPATAKLLLGDEGRLGLVFPEGTKGTGKKVSDRYRLQRFGRGGYVRVAIEAGVPIVPVAVLGAEEAMPVFAHLKPLAALMNLPYVPLTTPIWLPVKFRIRFLEPVDVAAGATDDHSVQLVSDGIREQIQDALVDMVAHRRNLLLG